MNRIIQTVFLLLAMGQNAIAYMWDRDEDYYMRHKTDGETFLQDCFMLFIMAMITRAVYKSYNKKGPVVGGIIFSCLTFMAFKNGVVIYGIAMACFVVYSYLAWNDGSHKEEGDLQE